MYAGWVMDIDSEANQQMDIPVNIWAVYGGYSCREVFQGLFLTHGFGMGFASQFDLYC
jgi:cellobiose phosphorylase